jgi:hypothetical protein
LSLETKQDIHIQKLHKDKGTALSNPDMLQLSDLNNSVRNRSYDNTAIAHDMIESIFSDSVDLAVDSSDKTVTGVSGGNDNISDSDVDIMRGLSRNSVDNNAGRSSSVSVFDRLALNGLVAAKKHRCWTPETDKVSVYHKS